MIVQLVEKMCKKCDYKIFTHFFIVKLHQFSTSNVLNTSSFDNKKLTIIINYTNLEKVTFRFAVGRLHHYC